MDRAEALKYEHAIRYNLTNGIHKEACDMAFDALREQEALEAELKGEKWRHGITKAKLEGTDMRSVVLCEHCQSGREPEGQAKGSGLVQCGNSGILYKPDHYCGDGRRKADSIVIRGTCADRLL